MKRNRRHIVNAIVCFAVKRLDVAKGVGKTQAGHADFIGSQTVEHKCVVRVWTMRHRDLARFTRLITARDSLLLFGNNCHIVGIQSAHA